MIRSENCRVEQHLDLFSRNCAVGELLDRPSAFDDFGNGHVVETKRTHEPARCIVRPMRLVDLGGRSASALAGAGG